MARKLTANDPPKRSGRRSTREMSAETAAPAPTKSNRAELIRGCVAEINRLQAEKDSIGEQIREVKARVKGELDMKISDFNVALRLAKLENDDRDGMLDTIRECFLALGIGEQGSLFPEKKGNGDDPVAAAADDADGAEEDAVAVARSAGKSDGKVGAPPNLAKYADGSREQRAYRDAYARANAKLAKAALH